MRWLKQKPQQLELVVGGRCRVRVDPDVNALYITFRGVNGVPVRTVQICQSPLVMVDYANDTPLGVEVIW